ncbi:hypothetical protein ACFLU6_12620 [Acidobacteriota bacterium]
MHNWYTEDEFCSVRYYTDFGSGLWHTPETNSRVKTDYGVSGYPTVMFQGTERVVGGGSSVATGQPYRDMYNTLVGTSAYELEITNLNLLGGTLDGFLEVVANPGSTAGLVVRGAVYENGLMDGLEQHDRVTRDVLTPVPLTVSGVGDTQSFSMPIDTSNFTNLDNGAAVIFIQDGAAGDIFQATCVQPPTDYAIAYSTSTQVYMVPIATTFSTDDLIVTNVGIYDDTVRVRISTDFAPPDWTVELTDGVATTQTELSTFLTVNQSQTYQLNINAASLGYGRFNVELLQDGLPGSSISAKYSILTEHLPFVVVDDDGGASTETAYTDALDAGGFTPYGVWPVQDGQIEAADLRTICIVLWTGGSGGTLSDADRDALTPFLDRGGKLYIAGNGIAAALDSAGGPALAWLENYLGSTYSDTSPFDALRIMENPGDPVGSGIDANTLGVLGADIIDPRPGSSISLYYGTSATYAAAVRGDAYKTILMGFDYSLILEVPQQELLMSNIIAWLEICQGCDAGVPGQIAEFKAHRSGGDIVFAWLEDNAVEDGYNIYGTNDGTQVGDLRSDAGCGDCTPLFTPPVSGATYTYTNGINDGPMYYQILGVCGGITEGPN